MSELKPCPFCGGYARVYDSRDHTAYPWNVECELCCVSTATNKTEKGAIEAWNKRTNNGYNRAIDDVIKIVEEIEAIRYGDSVITEEIKELKDENIK